MVEDMDDNQVEEVPLKNKVLPIFVSLTYILFQKEPKIIHFWLVDADVMYYIKHSM